MKLLTVLFAFICISAFKPPKTLTGNYTYAGDIENGRKEAGPADYSLKRIYNNTGFTAYIIQKGYKTEKYESGTYSLQNDTCIETQKWCSQSSKLLNIKVHYYYSFRKDTLVLNGVLPNGTHVEEYWKHIK